MQQVWNSVVSSKAAMLLLTIFILVIGSATFIEERFDTASARILIYDATWFEVLMFLLIALYILQVVNKKLYRKEKLAQLIFHFSFVFLFIGGGITRYFGYEANMHIVEKDAVKVIYSAEPYLQVSIPGEDIEYTSDAPLYFSQLADNSFQLSFGSEGNTPLQLTYVDYVFNAEEKSDGKGGVRYVTANSDQERPDALILSVRYNDKNYEAVLFYDDTRYVQPFNQFHFGELEVELTYGPKPIPLPFALQLDKFILTTYPGTDIPSASESRVTLIDERKDIVEQHRIAKNKVLDYDGYRFFQTSYDDDEKGTILSVNYDYYGTRITYFGYFLMLVGALLILVSKSSKFAQLDKQIKLAREKRKALLTTALLVLVIPLFGFSQYRSQVPISKVHADRFGKLLVQTYDGRYSSVHSLATDVIHKISGKDFFNFPGKGKMGPLHLFLDMHVDPEFWMHQKMIVIREKALRDLIGVSGKYASLNDFYENGQYKLDDLSIKAYKKKASDQTTLEREILKVTDRVNVFIMASNGTFLKLFPVQDSDNQQWVSWNDSLAFIPLYGELIPFNSDLQLDEFTYSNIMRNYLFSTMYAREANDYTIPDKLLKDISSIQRQLSPYGTLPSERKIELEVLYNKSRIFDQLKYVYLLLGIALLILTYIENFRLRSGKGINLVIKSLVGMIMLAFIAQTFGMGLRWYLGGHAPWSNGYEVLLLVAWGGMLAGFSVINYSKITLGATAVLAFLILMTAGHSYYDPQLTNLNPVLKSYWLIIHVAIITIGYGYLALSVLLGLINIILRLIGSGKRETRAYLVMLELTLINEKLLTIGMLLTAIGTFIGCIWANESWGTYWAWNAKQTWSLIIVLVYGVVLHFKHIPGLKSLLAFNIGSVLSFGSVLMTFIGVNYYFTKGLHSYASDDPPIFPLWAWLSIIAIMMLVVAAVIKERRDSQSQQGEGF